jgi:hypothetical protein
MSFDFTLKLVPFVYGTCRDSGDDLPGARLPRSLYIDRGRPGNPRSKRPQPGKPFTRRPWEKMVGAGPVVRRRCDVQWVRFFGPVAFP